MWFGGEQENDEMLFVSSLICTPPDANYTNTGCCTLGKEHVNYGMQGGWQHTHKIYIC